MRRKTQKAQAVGEYVVIITIAVAAFSATTILVKRALQARIKDANDYMLSTVNTAYQNSRAANETTPAQITKEYEPYYVETNSTVSRDVNDTFILLPDGKKTGKFNALYNQTTIANTISIQAPPKDGY